MSDVSESDGVAKADNLYKFQVGQVAEIRCGETFDQGPGLGDTRSKKDAHPGFDPSEEGFRGNNPLFPPGVYIVEHSVTSGRPCGENE